MKSLKKWFAQESLDTSVVSSDSESLENDSEGEVINRQERNINRKKRNQENKKKLKAEVALKASHTLGCQPISDEDIEKIRAEVGDINEARRLAVLDYLKNSFNSMKRS